MRYRRFLSLGGPFFPLGLVLYGLLAAPGVEQIGMSRADESTSGFASGSAPEATHSPERLASGLRIEALEEALATRVYTVGIWRSSRLYVGTENGLFVSDDQGQTWMELAINHESKAVFAVAVSPEVAQTLFVGTSRGLWKTEDGGRLWARIKAGLPTEYVALAMTFCAYAPRHAYLGTARHGVFRSFDGGNSWVPASAGLPGTLGGGDIAPVWSLLADPHNGEVAYIGTEVSGIYKTTDGGKTWQAINAGLPEVPIRRTYPPRLAISLADSSVLYAAIGNPIHSHLVRTALYRSTNGGASWHVIDTDLPSNLTVHSLEIDAADASTVYVRARQGEFAVSSQEALRRK